LPKEDPGDAVIILGKPWQPCLLSIALAAALGGCGSASPEVSSIRLESPAVDEAGVSNSTAGCALGSTWLPLRWSAVPKNTKELNIYFGRYEYKGTGADRRILATFGSLLVGVKPTIRFLPGDTWPGEAFAVDYRPLHACVTHPPGERILVTLFARPELGQVPVEHLSKDFATALTEEALGLDPRTEAPAAKRVIEDSLAVGHLTARFDSS
jgi:hypothetical protein